MSPRTVMTGATPLELGRLALSSERRDAVRRDPRRGRVLREDVLSASPPSRGTARP